MASENIPLVLELNGVDNASASFDKINGELDEFKRSSADAGKTSTDAAQKSTASWTEFRSAYSTVVDVARVAQDVWRETVGTTVELANSVRQMRDVTGQSAEESSRLIQVLDDYKVSVGDAEKATKALAKDGMEFNIQTIARLSDEYLALGTDVERTQFLYDKFGKSGDAFAETMKQGSEAILAANDAIDKNLVLTDKQLEAARDYEKALDNLNDRLTAQKVIMGNELIPVANTLLDLYDKTNETIETGNQTYSRSALYYSAVTMAQEKAVDSLGEMAEGMKELGRAVEDTSVPMEELEKDYTGLIEGAIATTKASNDYAKRQAEITEEIGKLQEEKAGYSQWEIDKIQATQDKIDDLSEKYAENAEAYKKAIEEKILASALEQISLSDGVEGYSEAEREKAQALLETSGTATAAAFEQVIAQQMVSDALAAGEIPLEKYGEVMDGVMADGVLSIQEVQAALDALQTQKTITLNIETKGYAGFGEGFSYATGDLAYQNPRRSNAMGGTYMIPQAWGNEGMPIGSSDSASGGELISITPKGKDPNADVVSAIYSTRIDYNELARAIVTASQQGFK